MGWAPASSLVPKPLGSSDPAMSSGPTSTVQARGVPTRALASCPEESMQGSPATDTPSTGPVPGSVGWLPAVGGWGPMAVTAGQCPEDPFCLEGCGDVFHHLPQSQGTGAGVRGSRSSTLPVTTSWPGGCSPAPRQGVTGLETVTALPGMGLSTQSGRKCVSVQNGREGSGEARSSQRASRDIHACRRGGWDQGQHRLSCLDTEGLVRPSDANMADRGQEVERLQRKEGPWG